MAETMIEPNLTEEAMYDAEPGYAPVNVVAYDEEREARSEAALHADDQDEPPHRRDCRCPDHGDWLGAS